jgi:hypothetical protein
MVNILCGDYVSARVWAIDYDGVNPATSTQITTAPGSITSFGQMKIRSCILFRLMAKFIDLFQQ